ncbi:Uncharacterised protein [Buttiauxella agrestis]|uniref:WYL domain-containing protein n=1 Tax=Buttiauxella agrestis TaxID=82977 RepID=A0A381C6T5_9ENTR|nr:hypothetical protein [Buttiauxella agrestis]SUW63532.1 Uncharacterised protein [Buttiauxella agrestis]
MIYTFALIGLISTVWAIRSIYLKGNCSYINLAKSLFAIIYFTAAVVMVKVDPLVTIVMLLLGSAIVSRSNQIYKSQNSAGKDLSNEHKSILVDIGAPKRMTSFSSLPSKNFTLGMDAGGLKNIAFNYVNANGESSFRDVDVKKCDGNYIEGYCHLSHKFKTFRIDRVEGDVILRDTGEMMNAYDWADELTSHKL